MSEGLNEHRKMMLMRGRPKILLATNFEEGKDLFEKYKDNLLGVISDVSYFKGGKRDPKAGFELLKYVRSYERYFPFLVQSSDYNNGVFALELKGKFLQVSDAYKDKFMKITDEQKDKSIQNYIRV